MGILATPVQGDSTAACSIAAAPGTRSHRRVMHRTTVAGAGPTAVDGRPIPVG